MQSRNDDGHDAGMRTMTLPRTVFNCCDAETWSQTPSASFVLAGVG